MFDHVKLSEKVNKYMFLKTWKEKLSPLVTVSSAYKK